MSIRKILVPVNGDAADQTALDAAAGVAAQLSAHVSALHVKASGDAALPFMGDTVSGAVIDDIIDRIEIEAEARLQKAQANFDDWQGNGHAGSGQSTFIKESGDRDTHLSRHARCSDLVVMKAANDEDGAAAAADIETVLVSGGRPVLLVPDAVSGDFANKGVVAWNDSVESTRALAAAMPFLEAADAVTLVSVQKDGDDGADLAPVAAYLGAHDVDASTRVIDPKDLEISDALVEHVRRHQGTLLVMGAYSHSRLKEQILGGVTQDILDLTEVPVLLVH